MKTAFLALENGMIFEGTAFGDTEAEAKGEVVFNTAMTGYQEAITDPSYKGQLLAFTYPHIGNYGVNADDDESGALQAEGMIVREYAKRHSNWRATGTLGEYLRKSEKIGIEGIDTRQLTRVLRSEGAMRGIISAKEENPQTLVERARNIPSMSGLDLTGAVTTTEAYKWENSLFEPIFPEAIGAVQAGTFRVAAMDFGIKRNILRRLTAFGCEVTVFPASATSEEILATEPDGIFLSNGPGDPAAVGYAIETIKRLAEKKAIFGICLGHQLLALAFGAQTYKLKFGHRGANHPVKNLLTEKIEITSQNHGFAVDAESLPEWLELTHRNLNDNTVEGFRHTELPIFCVQYHPEAAPGTHDSDYLFRDFIALMQTTKN